MCFSGEPKEGSVLPASTWNGRGLNRVRTLLLLLSFADAKVSCIMYCASFFVVLGDGPYGGWCIC